jgi:hypothetical protein
LTIYDDQQLWKKNPNHAIVGLHNFLLHVMFRPFILKRRNPSDVAQHQWSSHEMNTRKKRTSLLALLAMLCAAFIFTLTSAIPLKAQETITEFEPIGASPGTIAPVAPPERLETEPPDSAEMPEQVDPAASPEPVDSAEAPHPADPTQSPVPTESAQSPEQPETKGIGASAGGGTGTIAAANLFGGISPKKALIIGASVLGVAALLIAGGGGGSGGGGGTTPSH